MARRMHAGVGCGPGRPDPPTPTWAPPPAPPSGPGPPRPAPPELSHAPDATARLDALLDATETGEWEWDFTTGEITWSPTLGPLHGKPRGSAPGTHEEWRALIHPEDVPAREEAARRARSTGAGYELEF